MKIGFFRLSAVLFLKIVNEIFTNLCYRIKITALFISQTDVKRMLIKRQVWMACCDLEKLIPDINYLLIESDANPSKTSGFQSKQKRWKAIPQASSMWRTIMPILPRKYSECKYAHFCSKVCTYTIEYRINSEPNLF